MVGCRSASSEDTRTHRETRRTGTGARGASFASRRRELLLQSDGSALFLLGGNPLAALAQPERRQPVLVVVFQRRYREDSSALFSEAGKEAFQAMRMFRDRDPLSQPTRGEVRYPRGHKSNPLEQLAHLIRADLGVRVAFVESGGWDTHFAQGAATGAMANLMGGLAGSVAAFVEDVGDAVPVTLLLVTEFGRTVSLNGAGGTDHGHGGMMMVVGHGVRGGRVHGEWLGLEKRNLYEGRDLPVTTDFRDVFSEVAGEAFGFFQSIALFPGYRPKSVAVMSGGGLI